MEIQLLYIEDIKMNSIEKTLYLLEILKKVEVLILEKHILKFLQERIIPLNLLLYLLTNPFQLHIIILMKVTK